MNLKIIALKEDKTNELYASVECQQLLSMYDDFYPTTGFNIPWVGYFIIKEDKVAGSCSFVGQPQNGKVEIAYWTFKAFERQGVASFACKELISIASRTAPGITVTAKTAPERNASTKILENNGFLFTEVVQDEEIGDAWLWTYTAAVSK